MTVKNEIRNDPEDKPVFTFKSHGSFTYIEIKVPKRIEEEIRREVITTSGTLVSI